MQSRAIEQDVLGVFEVEEAELAPSDVYCWRLEQLMEAGYDRVPADELAADLDVDLHLACDLLARGCSQQLAFAIVS